MPKSTVHCFSVLFPDQPLGVKPWCLLNINSEELRKRQVAAHTTTSHPLFSHVAVQYLLTKYAPGK